MTTWRWPSRCWGDQWSHIFYCLYVRYTTRPCYYSRRLKTLLISERSMWTSLLTSSAAIVDMSRLTLVA